MAPVPPSCCAPSQCVPWPLLWSSTHLLAILILRPVMLCGPWGSQNGWPIPTGCRGRQTLLWWVTKACVRFFYATAYVPTAFKLPGKGIHSCPTGWWFPARALGGVSCSLVPWEMLGCRTSRGAGGSGCVAAGSCLPLPPSRALTVAVDDSQGCVPCATWPCPSRNKAPYLFTHGAQAVSQQPPPPSPPSAPRSRGLHRGGHLPACQSLALLPGGHCGLPLCGLFSRAVLPSAALVDVAGALPGARQPPPACATSPSGFPLQ